MEDGRIAGFTLKLRRDKVEQVRKAIEKEFAEIVANQGADQERVRFYMRVLIDLDIPDDGRLKFSDCWVEWRQHPYLADFFKAYVEAGEIKFQREDGEERAYRFDGKGGAKEVPGPFP